MEKMLTGTRNGAAIHNLACGVVAEAKVIANDAPYTQPIIANIETGIASYLEWSGTQAIDPNVKKLEIYDEGQDNAFVWMRDYTKAMIHSPDATVAAHATALWTVFERHGTTLYTEGYADEQSDLRALLTELNAAPLQNAVNATGLRPWIDRLTAAASAFNGVFTLRASSGKTTDATKSKSAQATMMKYINLLLSSLQMLEETSKNAAVLARLKTINGLVGQYNAKLRASRTRAESETDEPAK